MSGSARHTYLYDVDLRSDTAAAVARDYAAAAACNARLRVRSFAQSLGVRL